MLVLNMETKEISQKAMIIAYVINLLKFIKSKQLNFLSALHK